LIEELAIKADFLTVDLGVASAQVTSGRACAPRLIEFARPETHREGADRVLRAPPRLLGKAGHRG
jgi:hypothetical protein